MANQVQVSDRPFLFGQQESGNYGYSGLPPEQALAERALARKQQIANLLMTQGLSQAQVPGQMVGRFYVPASPVQGLAGIGQMLAGLVGSHVLDKQGEQIQSDQNERTAQAVQDYLAKTQTQEVPEHALPQGSPEVEAQPSNLDEIASENHPAIGIPSVRTAPSPQSMMPVAPLQSSQPTGIPYQPPVEAQPAVPPTEGPVNPAMTIKPDPAAARAAMVQAMVSQNPTLQHIGTLDYQQAQANREHEATRQFQAQEHALTRESTAANAKMQLDAMVANKLITQDQATGLLAQNQKLHDERMAVEKERDRQNALQIKGLETEAKKEGKTPPGYRQIPGGNLEAIPGGPADTKKQLQFNQDTSSLENTNAALDRLQQTARELRSHSGLPGITGLRGRIPNVPGTSAADAQALMDTLKSKVGFGVLQEMRNNSKSGGALGAISDMENKLLQNNLEPLAKEQSHEAMVKSLKGIEDYVDQAKERLRNAYNLKHPDSGSAPMVAPLVSGIVAPFNDADKERRYQEFKRNHK